MIRKLSIILFFLSSNISLGQINKRNWLVGGNGSFSFNKNSSTDLKTSKLQLAPNIGYFFADNLAGGIKADLTFQKDSYYSDGNGVRTTIFLLGPFLRYYFFDKDQIFNFLIEGNYGYGTYSKNGIYPINGGKLSQYSFLLGPVLYFNSSVGLEFTIGYYNKNDITSKVINSGLLIGLGLQIHLLKN